DELALVPGSYRIFGENVSPTQYTPAQIKQKLLDDYLLSVINNNADFPESGFDLERADGNKIADTLEWKALSIDDKHEYILKKYLNPTENAYINDKNDGGYEMAYLVLDGAGGEGDSFEMNFNKDLPEETDERFDPLRSEDISSVNAEGSLEDSNQDYEAGRNNLGGTDRE